MCACSVPWTKQTKIPNCSEWLNWETESQRERERENPKAENPAAKCEGHHRSTAKPSLTAPPHAYWLLLPPPLGHAWRHAPFARSGSALRSGMFLFCFVLFCFFFFSSLILFLWSYLLQSFTTWQPGLLVFFFFFDKSGLLVFVT